jgi:hypothetical protein
VGDVGGADLHDHGPALRPGRTAPPHRPSGTEDAARREPRRRQDKRAHRPRSRAGKRRIRACAGGQSEPDGQTLREESEPGYRPDARLASSKMGYPRPRNREGARAGPAWRARWASGWCWRNSRSAA